MLKHEQPIILQLLDVHKRSRRARDSNGTGRLRISMLQQVVITDDPKVAFRDAEIVLLVGARPRSKVWNAKI